MDLKTLNKELKKTHKKSAEIRNKIEQIEINKVLPTIKEKYEGKYWKYRNRTSGDESWWLYSFCIEAIDKSSGKFHQFETTPYEYKFNVCDHGYYHLCQEEISKYEYMIAFDEFRLKMNKLTNTTI